MDQEQQSILDLTILPANEFLVHKNKEELKIREEMENDVERDLEEEIKDGIYHQALRLHRLYQSQKQRNHGRLLEVNINIKLDGGTKIEIKEVKKEGAEKKSDHVIRRDQTCRPRTSMNTNTKRFDWTRTLRSSAGPVVGKRNGYIGSSNHQSNMHGIWK